jgi:hypothetical protein
METATAAFLAQLIGPILFLVGLGLVINRDVYRAAAEEVLRSRALTYESGLLALTAGLAIVLNHNVWTTKGWLLIITVTGWLLVLRGVLRILMPQQTGDRVAQLLARWPQILTVSGFLIGFLGGVLIWHGYIEDVR